MIQPIGSMEQPLFWPAFYSFLLAFVILGYYFCIGLVGLGTKMSEETSLNDAMV